MHEQFLLVLWFDFLFTTKFLPEMNEQQHCLTHAICASGSRKYGKSASSLRRNEYHFCMLRFVSCSWHLGMDDRYG